jgi:hypothetical protein
MAAVIISIASAFCAIRVLAERSGAAGRFATSAFGQRCLKRRDIGETLGPRFLIRSMHDLRPRESIVVRTPLG